MPETIDDIGMINRALRRIGAGQIFALDEDTELAQQAVQIYHDRMAALIGSFRFTWARKTYALSKLAATPENGWKFAYAIPGTAIEPVPVKLLEDPRDPDHPLRLFLVEAGEIYADCEPLWGTFIIMPPPSVWPALFREAAIIDLASAYCVPITHDKALAESLAVMAGGTPQEQGRGGLMGRALQVNAAGSQPSAHLGASDPLTSAHLS
jgi:hypothetical protein